MNTWKTLHGLLALGAIFVATTSVKLLRRDDSRLGTYNYDVAVATTLYGDNCRAGREDLENVKLNSLLIFQELQTNLLVVTRTADASLLKDSLVSFPVEIISYDEGVLRECEDGGDLVHLGKFCTRVVLFRALQDLAKPLLYFESDVLILDGTFLQLRKLGTMSQFAATPAYILGNTREANRYINVTHDQFNVGIFTVSHPQLFFAEEFFQHMAKCKTINFAGFNDMHGGTLEQVCMSIYVHLYVKQTMWMPQGWQCRGYLFHGVAHGNLDNCFAYHHHNNKFARDYVRRKFNYRLV